MENENKKITLDETKIGGIIRNLNYKNIKKNGGSKTKAEEF